MIGPSSLGRTGFLGEMSSGGGGGDEAIPGGIFGVAKTKMDRNKEGEKEGLTGT